MDHIEVTAAGFTHWSSSPGSRTFDPECGACWEQYAHKLEAAQHALDSATFRERPAPGLVAACLRALQKYKEFQAVDPRDVEGAHKAFTEWLSLAADWLVRQSGRLILDQPAQTPMGVESYSHIVTYCSRTVKSSGSVARWNRK